MRSPAERLASSVSRDLTEASRFPNRSKSGSLWQTKEVCHGSGNRVRDDYESTQLRELARQSEDAAQVRRLLALASVYDGGSRSVGARAGGVGLQTFRDWVLRFNAMGPAGLVDGKAPGQVPRLDRAQRRELAQLVEDGPIPARAWGGSLAAEPSAEWVMEKYRTSISEQTLSRYLREVGYRMALLSKFGPVVLMDFGPPPVPQPTVARVYREARRGLESQSGFVRAAASGA